MTDLPNDLDQSEIGEVDRLLQNIIAFIASPKCAKWCSYALMLNIIGGWVAILGQNIVEALAATYRSLSTSQHPSWANFNHVRCYFLENYLSILHHLHCIAF